MHIEKFQKQDLDQLSQIQPADWDDISPHFEIYLRSPYCQALKMTIDGQLIAVGAIIYHQKTAWLAHVIVSVAHRNKGIGRQLTNGLLSAIDRNQYPSIYLIATDLGYPVYLKVGFHLIGTYHQLKLKEDINHAQTSIHIQTYTSEHYQEIIAMDRLISGEDRSTFITSYLDDCLIWRKSNRLCGVYFPTMYDGYIMATHQNAGIELLTERAKKFDYAILPTENESGYQHLLSLGYELTSSSRRMVVGPAHNWHPDFIYNRISGQIG